MIFEHSLVENDGSFGSPTSPGLLDSLNSLRLSRPHTRYYEDHREVHEVTILSTAANPTPKSHITRFRWKF